MPFLKVVGWALDRTLANRLTSSALDRISLQGFRASIWEQLWEQNRPNTVLNRDA